MERFYKKLLLTAIGVLGVWLAVNAQDTACKGTTTSHSITTSIGCSLGGGGNVYFVGASGGSISNAGSSTFNVSWTSSGTFRIRRSFPSGCHTTQIDIVVTVYDQPAAPSAPSVSTNTCGDKILTRGNPPGGVTWYWHKSGVGSLGSTAQTLTVSEPGTYYLRAKNNGDCWSTNGASRNVTFPPDLNAGSINSGQNRSGCPGLGPFTLYASTATGTNVQYKWTRNSVDIPNSNQEDLYVSSVDEYTTFRRFVKDACNDWVQSSGFVTVDIQGVNPGAIAPTQTAYCYGGGAFINSTQNASAGQYGVSYSWTTSPYIPSSQLQVNGASLEIRGTLAAGTYTVWRAAQNTGGACNSTQSVSTTFTIRSQVATGSISQSVECNGIQLTHNGVGGTAYWEDGNGNFTVTGPKTVASTGSYAYRVKNGHHCWSETAYAVVDNIPVFSAGTLTPGQERSGCPGIGPFTLSGSPATGKNVEYKWKKGNSDIPNSNVEDLYLASVDEAATYYRYVRDDCNDWTQSGVHTANENDDFVEMDIQDVTPGSIEMGDDFFCYGSSSLTISSQTDAYAGQYGVVYTWSSVPALPITHNGSSATITGSIGAGTYTVTRSAQNDGGSCSTKRSTSVSFTVYDPVPIGSLSTVVGCDFVTLTHNGEGTAYFADANDDYVLANQLDVYENGDYTYKVRDANGCWSDPVSVEVDNVPLFSPGGLTSPDYEGCPTGEVTLYGSPGSGTNVQYRWLREGAVMGTEQNLTLSTVDGYSTFYREVKDDCHDWTLSGSHTPENTNDDYITYDIEVLDPGEIVEEKEFFCHGETVIVNSLADAKINNGQIGGVEYRWSTSASVSLGDFTDRDLVYTGIIDPGTYLFTREAYGTVGACTAPESVTVELTIWDPVDPGNVLKTPDCESLILTHEGTGTGYWPAEGNESSESNPTAITVTAPGTYYYQVIDGNGCWSLLIPVAVAEEEIVPFEVGGIIDSDYAGCALNDEVVIDATPATGFGVEYKWARNNADIPNSNMEDLILDNITVSGTYRRFVRDNCHDWASGTDDKIYFEIQDIDPGAITPASDFFCYGAGAFVESTEPAYAGRFDVTYNWIIDPYVPGEQRSDPNLGYLEIHGDLDPGVYTVTRIALSPEADCNNEPSVVTTFTVRAPVPTGSVEVTTSCVETTLIHQPEIGGNGETNVVYWQPGPETELAEETGPKIIDKPGVYWYKTLDENGCWSAADSIEVEHVEPPLRLYGGGDFEGLGDVSFTLSNPYVDNTTFYYREGDDDPVAVEGNYPYLVVQLINDSDSAIDRAYWAEVANDECTVNTNLVNLRVLPYPEENTQDMNRVDNYSAREAGLENLSAVDDPEQVQEAINYFDELGRSVETVAVAATPAQTDLIVPVTYDALGRQDRSYLPYPSAYGNGSFRLVDEVLTNQQNWYAANKGDEHAYSQTVFEEAPTNRVLKQGAPGASWQPSADPYGLDDHTVKSRFLLNNEADEVYYWVHDYVTNNPKLHDHEVPYYEATSLNKTVSYDEHQHQVLQFTDDRGLTVLKRVQEDEAGTGWMDTYYVYDDFGSLRTVIQPEGSKRLNAEYFDLTDEEQEDFLVKWCFRYQYDGRKRMVVKQVPGAEAVEMVYNEKDLLVLTRDGNQREKDQWLQTTFDQLNRPASTRLKVATIETEELRNIVAGTDPRTLDEVTEPVGGVAIASPTIEEVVYPAPTDITEALTLTALLSGEVSAATIHWGDGISDPMSIDGQTVTASHQYAWPDLFQVTIELTDTYGATRQYSLDEELVVFDREGLYVSGSGYYHVEHGEFQAAPDTSGRLVFSFNASYAQGASVPSGFTGIFYESAGAIYQSLEMDWMVVTGAMVHYRATGFDQASNLLFMELKVIDGEHLLDDEYPEDLLYVRVWDQNGLIYESDWESVAQGHVTVHRPGEGSYVAPTGVKQLPPTIENPGPSIDNTRAFLTDTQYDAYDFLEDDDWTGKTYFEFEPVFTEPPLEEVIGQLTGSSTRILGTDDFLRSVIYYDDRYRPIQTISENHQGGYDRVSNRYDFIGNILETRQEHYGADTIHTNRRFYYDHGNRLLEMWHQVGEQEAVLLVRNEYNALGELIDKKLHCTNCLTPEELDTYTPLPEQLVVNEYRGESSFKATHGISFVSGFEALGSQGDQFVARVVGPPSTVPSDEGQYLQSVDYTYNIRGWLTHVNDVELSAPETANTRYDDLFGMELQYEGAGDHAQYNGNIGRMQWKNAQQEQRQEYQYRYDPTNRLVSADFGVGGNYNGVSNFDVGLIDYDANGNILALNRMGQYDPIDEMVYAYNGNQLLSVADHSLNEKGFKDGATAVEEYTYDANGNMDADANKGIASISYNFLNLPSEVVFDDQKKIQYVYDAAGIKLQQIVFEGNRRDTTDYLSGFIYKNDTLQLIQHEEGRLTPATANEGLTYEYHLKDHLGNVRVTFTSNTGSSQYPLTAETEQATFEEEAYRNVAESRQQDAAHARTGDEMIRLNAADGRIVGPAISLQVARGDTVSMSAWGKYTPVTAVDNNLTGLAAAVTNAFGANPAGETAHIFSALNEALAGSTLMAPDEDSQAPKAYLQYIFFDENYVYQTLGYDNVKENALSYEKLGLELVAPNNGYVYIYLSNETAADVNVYFDDMEVIHKEGPVVQTDDYYPFGLTFNEWKREGNKMNRFLFNEGSERQDDFGLNVDLTKYRAYDPAIGRWWQVDPKADSLIHQTPYNSMDNNPIRYNDPLGDCPQCYELFKQAFTGFMNALGFQEQPAKKIKVKKQPKTSEAQKEDSGIKDGIVTVKDQEGDQPDNAQKGDGKVVVEPSESPVGVKKPGASSRTRQLYDVFLAPFVDLTETEYSPVPGDSGVYFVKKYENGKWKLVPKIGVKLKPGGGISPRGAREAKDKKDSAEYNIR